MILSSVNERFVYVLLQSSYILNCIVVQYYTVDYVIEQWYNTRRYKIILRSGELMSYDKLIDKISNKFTDSELDMIRIRGSQIVDDIKNYRDR